MASTGGAGRSAPPAGQVAADSVYGPLVEVLRALGVPEAHGLGFSGAGVRIGILGGSFDLEHPALAGATVVAMRDFVDDDADVGPDPADPGTAAHGTALWSLVGASRPGTLVGGAFGASFVLARVLSGEPLSSADEERWVAGLEWLESQGARIIVSGVGFRVMEDLEYPFEALDGESTAASRAAAPAAERGVLVVTGMGNRGPQEGSLETPADARDVLAVGAAGPDGGPAESSGRGPTADGRTKPDALAPGVDVPAAGVDPEEDLVSVEGTEFAAALLAGGAALFVEAHPGRGPVEVLTSLTGSAVGRDAGREGIPDVAAAVLFPDGLRALPLEEVSLSGTVTSLVPLFQWDAPSVHPLALPVTFRVQVSSDSTFGQVVLADTVVGTFARRFARPLPPRTRLFWRVEAEAVGGVRRRTATEGPVTVPPWVELRVLNDPRGTSVEEAQPEFRWEAFPVPAPQGPLGFELQVLSDRLGEPLDSFPGLTTTVFRIPRPLPFNEPLRWRVIARAPGGGADTATSAGPFVVTSRFRPPVTLLYQNFPNPFPRRELGATETRVWFDLDRSGPVELAVHDMRGRTVRRLIPRAGCAAVTLEPGEYGRGSDPVTDPCILLRWDGRDDGGREVSRGVYVLRLRAPGVEEVRRVVYWP